MEAIKAVNASSVTVQGSIGQDSGAAKKPDTYETAEPKGTFWGSILCATARMNYNWHTGECTQYPNHVWNFRR